VDGLRRLILGIYGGLVMGILRLIAGNLPQTSANWRSVQHVTKSSPHFFNIVGKHLLATYYIKCTGMMQPDVVEL
jgi:hypothetical protein